VEARRRRGEVVPEVGAEVSVHWGDGVEFPP
jgi:hypothetical protein